MPATQIGVTEVGQHVELSMIEPQRLQGQLVQPTAGAYLRQLPLMHSSLALHAFPQSPQCSGFVPRSTHA